MSSNQNVGQKTDGTGKQTEAVHEVGGKNVGNPGGNFHGDIATKKQHSPSENIGGNARILSINLSHSPDQAILIHIPFKHYHLIS